MYERVVFVCHHREMIFTDRKHLMFERLYNVLITVIVLNHLCGFKSMLMFSDYEKNKEIRFNELISQLQFYVIK